MSEEWHNVTLHVRKRTFCDFVIRNANLILIEIFKICIFKNLFSCETIHEYINFSSYKILIELI